ncbi:hypothetical protein [Paenibacillus polymyxa]|uniref:RES domain-containing protein n=1 Tax=Paenibacillus polymyxa (strain SC2) TaxID=886882 RepID=E3EKH7_PAEPS|nr:hypothetical protein [Paenibacillus polymyxa]ADO59809.1 hypothetical protein PPSC2_26115 [Paenibacillus polymyxa SC2]WPQ59956.1 hypothetical protein SKN87_27320 [Paenibacillus polymyxa]
MRTITELQETILCHNCGEIVIVFFEKYGYKLVEMLPECVKKEHDGIEGLCCACCDEEIQVMDNYYIFTVGDEIIDEIADRVGEDMGGCEHCEGEKRWNLVNAYNNDPYDKSSRMDSPEGMSISAYLYDQDVPEELFQILCTHIQCKCSYGRESGHSDDFYGGIFDLNDEIYTKRDIEDYWGFKYEAFSEFSQQYEETIEVEALHQFKTHLSHYPMLALEHKTGRAIYRTLKKHFDAKGYTVLTNGLAKLYRGRTRRMDTSVPLEKHQMWAPPVGLPQHGRYNCVGIPVLYVTDCLESIPYEIHPTHEDIIDIGEFRITKDELFIFDLGSFEPTFQGFFNEMNEETKLVKEAYLLPNFIGTCCSYIGYHGIKYEGVHGEKLSYTNYALFNIESEEDIKINNIISYKPQFTIEMKEISKLPYSTLDSEF